MWDILLSWLHVPAELQSPEATIRSAQLTAQVALIAAAVAFVSAIIAGVVALRNGYLTVRSNAALKHADFRQLWINRLRDEMGTLQSLAVNYKPGDADGETKFIKSLTTILMLMNRDDPDYQLLIDHMNAILVSKESTDASHFFDAYVGLTDICQDILKREWEVTKREMHATARWLPTRMIIGTWHIGGRALSWTWRDLQKDMPTSWQTKLGDRRARKRQERIDARRRIRPKPLTLPKPLVDREAEPPNP